MSALARWIVSNLRYRRETPAVGNAIARLMACGEPGSRTTFPLHLTAGAFAVSTRGLLVVPHLTLGLSLAPGGHIEAGEIPPEAALRELEEETGLAGRIVGGVFDLDLHPIPANPGKGEPAHEHLDVGFLIEVDADRPPSPVLDGGVGPYRWIAVEDLAAFPETRIARLAGRLADAAARISGGIA